MTIQRTRSLGRPTLDAVAARAGVGRGTVSRVVNGSPQVSPEARAAVQQAIAELGYVPNRAARALVTQRTDAVALVVSESGEQVFAEAFFTGIVRGVSTGLLGTPMQLWLALARSPLERERVEHHLTSQHVDGVLLLSRHDADPLPTLLAERGLPTVLGGRPARMPRPGAQPAHFVDVDDVGGARQAVEYLVGKGRRRIATIAGPQDTGAGRARLTGYREAVAASEGQVDPAMIAYGDLSEASGAAGMRQLLASRPDLDAVLVASDLMACGALRALREAGRRVPEDVAIIGYEDSPIARQSDPPLTTVAQPIEEMGRQMARLLVARIRGEALPAPHVLLPPHLIPRISA
ncbi:DNA-binding transcriptional regulator, LacI/PurR family [Micromonospora pallida]|uniref:DNA-binding transcriptional regulator, LacI/PurR family n=1 Tax=Micromonospora pallida TaxID=145854 RepID=A0A1C6SUM1_9ACTN|nr:LacI family DNA-binding transcriptional regulator [Micromonospora pallida]SCL32835.1 DNA-binding transcriptional regulator, LacI/PurR family [Micromonospora pallida]